MTHVQRSVQRAGERFRGGDPDAGIETWHAFSFSGFYDPDNVRFGPLAACNEERLAPGAGFAEHPHRDVELVTWVVEGELTHEDSTGHIEVVRPGDVQRLSAGAGVRHSERNEGAEPLRFVQMWLTPAEYGGEPSYEVVRGVADGTSYALAGGEAVLHVRRLGAGERSAVPDAPWVYVHVVRGAVRLDGELLEEGDAARILDSARLAVEAVSPAELLMWEMHAEPHFG
ncbi:pirin family protein [Streptomyces roseoverticillatus]|uniref:pirin family protein n=1 Tax=Streptomyces roseoverticillatus TaxID=66429 RepID=UPI001F162FD8|nr:pirin-like bicupin family protein [Streptomyces roseoverticillatus]MCF3106847.1 pirin family protein [Streptomyces roseoverticillatus]